MKLARILPALGAVAFAIAAGPALAHPGHGADALAGLAHPLTGADHLLAMTAVGLLAAQRGGRALWAWPAAFVAAMLAGYGLGLAAPGVPLVEPAILASVMVLGALTAAQTRTPLALGIALIGAFGLCHGYAHGAESPADAGLGFPLGFALTTAALHAAGVGLGLAAMRLRRPGLLAAAGLGVAAGGVLLALAG
jgi:urease accessory protein